MKTTLKLLAFFFAVCAAANAQVEPAALAGGANLSYALRYAETAEFGASLGTWQTINASGSLDYANGSDRIPFMVDYAGGYTWTLTGPTYSTGLFQRMLLSQGIVWRKWNVLVSDDVSYRPQSPVTGFSGIPGIGEPIGGTSPAPPSSQSILTLNTHVVNNIATGLLENNPGSKSILSAGGGMELLRYPDGNGLDTDTKTANAGLAEHLDARDSIFGKYAFFDYTYPNYVISFVTNAGLVGFQRQWSRTVTSIAAAGPEKVNSSDPTKVPDSLTFAANGAIEYKSPFASALLSYRHGINGGEGYLLGAEWNSIDGNFTRDFGMNLTIGLTGGYVRTSGLNSTAGTNTSGLIIQGVTNGIYGGAQGSWRIGRNIIVFANYTGRDQTSTSKLPTNVLNQLLQVIGFGFGYSPREPHTRQ